MDNVLIETLYDSFVIFLIIYAISCAIMDWVYEENYSDRKK